MQSWTLTWGTSITCSTAACKSDSINLRTQNSWSTVCGTAPRVPGLWARSQVFAGRAAPRPSCDGCRRCPWAKIRTWPDTHGCHARPHGECDPVLDRARVVLDTCSLQQVQGVARPLRRRTPERQRTPWPAASGTSAHELHVRYRLLPA